MPGYLFASAPSHPTFPISATLPGILIDSTRIFLQSQMIDVSRWGSARIVRALDNNAAHFDAIIPYLGFLVASARQPGVLKFQYLSFVFGRSAGIALLRPQPR